jgi:tetratricopeptide (TPR) repeat protein
MLVDSGDFENARNVTKAGMAAMPRNYQLLQDFVMIDLKATGLDAALATADNLASQDRDFAPARALRGDIYLAANRPLDAIKAYTDAQVATPSSLLLTRLVAAQLRAGQAQNAQSALEAWVAKHPDDTTAVEQLAEINIATGRLDLASKNLQIILSKKPHDPVALNNLAWVYQQLHDDRALDLARQAYVLSPGAQTADTLGWILTSAGKADTGVDLLRQASAEATNDPRVQYHYAVALKDTGDKTTAIKLLTAIVAVKSDFAEKVQAQQLLDALNKGS